MSSAGEALLTSGGETKRNRVVNRSIHPSTKPGQVHWSVYQEETNRLRKIRVNTGGNYYRNVTARVGRRFARTLIASALEGRTSFVESLRLLDIKKMSAFKEIARNLGVGS